MSDKQEKYFKTFINNLKEGINYYYNLFNTLKYKFEETKAQIINDLESSKNSLSHLLLEIGNISMTTTSEKINGH